MCFEPDLDPKNSPIDQKIAPKGQKSAKETQNVAELKTKRKDYNSKTKVDCLHR